MKLYLVAKLLVAGTVLLSTCGSSYVQGAEAVGSDDRPDVLMRWHRATLTFEGPATSETAEPNPYFDYRLDVTF